jgi:hypothetical protein
MSIIIIFASCVDYVLLIKILNVVIAAVDVAVSPPTVSLTRCFSFLLGLKSQTNLPYVILRFFGMLFKSIKKAVFVPAMSRMP